MTCPRRVFFLTKKSSICYTEFAPLLYHLQALKAKQRVFLLQSCVALYYNSYLVRGLY